MDVLQWTDWTIELDIKRYARDAANIRRSWLGEHTRKICFYITIRFSGIDISQVLDRSFQTSRVKTPTDCWAPKVPVPARFGRSTSPTWSNWSQRVTEVYRQMRLSAWTDRLDCSFFVADCCGDLHDVTTKKKAVVMKNIRDKTSSISFWNLSGWYIYWYMTHIVTKPQFFFFCGDELNPLGQLGTRPFCGDTSLSSRDSHETFFQWHLAAWLQKRCAGLDLDLPTRHCKQRDYGWKSHKLVQDFATIHSMSCQI